MSCMSAALIISYITKFLLPARFRPYDLMTTICNAEWAKSTTVVVSITKFWHWMWWRTLLLLLNLLLAGHCHHTYGSVEFCKHRIQSSPFMHSLYNVQKRNMQREGQNTATVQLSICQDFNLKASECSVMQ
jgi:hypothetical protein